MSSYYELNGVKSNEPLPGPFYGQRILGVHPQGNISSTSSETSGPSVGVHIHVGPSNPEFLPGGVPDPQGRVNLNDEYLRKRELLEAIMEKEMELEQMKRDLVEHISSAK